MNESLRVVQDELTSDAIIGLLRAHLALMRSLSPPESVHALDLDGLRAAEITFWRAETATGELLGCGALKALDAETGEIKSMHTAAAHRGKGVAAALLAMILVTARERGYTRLYLETGSQPGFAPARAFYAAHGFSECPPFGDYTNDPASFFMTRTLS
jgi:putative acetyltransferase|tara:strand:- start:1938 stop:2411 length:474 start_codon:yes stop_codon:yes gene_type:complete